MRLRTNNGLEFCSKEFDELCRDKGIARHHTVRDTPQQNRITKRMNIKSLKRARCLLFNAKMGRSYWAEAVNTVCYLVNRSPATAIDCKTPIKVWSDKPADYKILKIFGCPPYYHVSEGKLEPRAKKNIFMGYGNGMKGYRIWFSSEKKVILSKNITFDENYMLHPKLDSVDSEKSDSVPKQIEFEITPSDSHDDDVIVQTDWFGEDI
ncbi:hypothetical protein NE237_018161 [Protea cynaroides]|uniref:Integrase catalytic domain-containing protein n=1 Tax=Protea cynaroides TaxID=273540 RepID=A0A9Q0QNQ9_9MAGN|nr:hypothetical protein NE237_018161 [Protea cynaroides]